MGTFNSAPGTKSAAEIELDRINNERNDISKEQEAIAKQKKRLAEQNAKLEKTKQDKISADLKNLVTEYARTKSSLLKTKNENELASLKTKAEGQAKSIEDFCVKNKRMIPQAIVDELKNPRIDEYGNPQATKAKNAVGRMYNASNSKNQLEIKRKAEEAAKQKRIDDEKAASEKLAEEQKALADAAEAERLQLQGEADLEEARKNEAAAEAEKNRLAAAAETERQRIINEKKTDEEKINELNTNIDNIQKKYDINEKRITELNNKENSSPLTKEDEAERTKLRAENVALNENQNIFIAERNSYSEKIKSIEEERLRKENEATQEAARLVAEQQARERANAEENERLQTQGETDLEEAHKNDKEKPFKNYVENMQQKGLGGLIEKLSEVPGYNELSEGQKMLVMQGMSDKLLKRVRNESEETNTKVLSEKGFFGKMWHGLVKNTRNAEYTKASLSEYTGHDERFAGKRAEFMNSSVSELVKVFKDSGVGAHLENGKLVTEFASVENPSEGMKAVMEHYNRIASEHHPYEHSLPTATPKQRKAYEAWEKRRESAKEAYQAELVKAGITKDVETKLGLTPEMAAFKMASDQDNMVKLMSYLYANEDSSKQLRNIQNRSAFRQGFANDINEKGYAMAIGMGARRLFAPVTALAGPALSSIMGAIRGKQRAEKTIRENAIKAMEGQKKNNFKVFREINESQKVELAEYYAKLEAEEDPQLKQAIEKKIAGLEKGTELEIKSLQKKLAKEQDPAAREQIINKIAGLEKGTELELKSLRDRLEILRKSSEANLILAEKALKEAIKNPSDTLTDGKPSNVVDAEKAVASATEEMKTNALNQAEEREEIRKRIYKLERGTGALMSNVDRKQKQLTDYTKQLNEATSDIEKKKIADHLKTVKDFIEAKLSLGHVDFGEEKERFARQSRLMTALNEAEVALAVYTKKEDILNIFDKGNEILQNADGSTINEGDDRARKLLTQVGKHNYDAMMENRSAYKRNEILKGAAMGGIFGSLGYSVSNWAMGHGIFGQTPVFNGEAAQALEAKLVNGLDNVGEFFKGAGHNISNAYDSAGVLGATGEVLKEAGNDSLEAGKYVVNEAGQLVKGVGTGIYKTGEKLVTATGNVFHHANNLNIPNVGNVPGPAIDNLRVGNNFVPDQQLMNAPGGTAPALSQQELLQKFGLDLSKYPNIPVVPGQTVAEQTTNIAQLQKLGLWPTNNLPNIPGNTTPTLSQQELLQKLGLDFSKYNSTPGAPVLSQQELMQRLGLDFSKYNNVPDTTHLVGPVPGNVFNSVPATPLTLDDVKHSIAHTEFSDKGATQTLEDFRHSASFKNLPPEMRNVFHGNINEIAKEMKMYLPNAADGKESLFVGQGSEFGVTKNGDVFIVDSKDPSHVINIGHIQDGKFIPNNDATLHYRHANYIPKISIKKIEKIPITSKYDRPIELSKDDLLAEQAKYLHKIEVPEIKEQTVESFHFTNDELEQMQRQGDHVMKEALNTYFPKHGMFGHHGFHSIEWKATKEMDASEFMNDHYDNDSGYHDMHKDLQQIVAEYKIRPPQSGETLEQYMHHVFTMRAGQPIMDADNAGLDYADPNHTGVEQEFKHKIPSQIKNHDARIRLKDELNGDYQRPRQNHLLERVFGMKHGAHAVEWRAIKRMPAEGFIFGDEPKMGSPYYELWHNLKQTIEQTHAENPAPNMSLEKYATYVYHLKQEGLDNAGVYNEMDKMYDEIKPESTIPEAQINRNYVDYIDKGNTIHDLIKTQPTGTYSRQFTDEVLSHKFTPDQLNEINKDTSASWRNEVVGYVTKLKPGVWSTLKDKNILEVLKQDPNTISDPTEKAIVERIKSLYSSVNDFDHSYTDPNTGKIVHSDFGQNQTVREFWRNLVKKQVQIEEFNKV